MSTSTFPSFHKLSVQERVRTVRAELLRLAAGLERGSEHPLADAIVGAAEARGLALSPAEGFTSLTGRGVRGRRCPGSNAAGPRGRAGGCTAPPGRDR